ncbi:hypothetical protein LRS06_10640 [Hymenobacter sp. J193]|uniref:hypothetical protein n=1 Tax=Hymenobacter sp. J193 TaxID=2898429 RepID=UPI002150E8E5|nr:hypothetical protein [Hymenobacter sp. J193]MCR5888214.1 hypothetical protein [Hymenobacter sp. J193]
MRAFVFALLAGLAAFPAYAQRLAPTIPASGRTAAAFVPAGYALLPEGRATGDLNQDGRPDVALVLRPLAENRPYYDSETMPGRILLVLFATARGYMLAEQANQVMLCKNCGGQYGDPFAGLTIRKGVLVVNHYGGSSWRWGVSSKFRYQQRGFYLIGETTTLGRSSGDCENVAGSPGGEYHDINFVTGAYEVRKISETCQVLVHQRGKRKPAPLRRLANYTPET